MCCIYSKEKNKKYEKLSYCNSTLLYYDNYNNVCITSPCIFEIDKVLGEGENFVVDDTDIDKMTYSQQIIQTQCKSPCASSAEMCIAMCA